MRGKEHKLSQSNQSGFSFEKLWGKFDEVMSYATRTDPPSFTSSLQSGCDTFIINYFDLANQ